MPALIAGLVLIADGFLWKYSSHPLFAVTALGGVYAGWCARRSTRWRVLWANLAIACVIVFAAETLATWLPTPRNDSDLSGSQFEDVAVPRACVVRRDVPPAPAPMPPPPDTPPTPSEFYTALDPDLGYATARNVVVDAMGFPGTPQKANAHVTTGIFGERRGHAGPGALALFFGCSFTFGYGLDDRETFPYQLAELSAGRLRDVNFGIPAGGPNQALALMLSGRDLAAVGSQPVAFGVYTVIRDQILRVGGRSSLKLGGPRFLLESSELHRDGNFELWNTPALYYLRKAAIIRRFFDWCIRQAKAHDLDAAEWQKDLDLSAALIVRAHDIFVSRYHAPFVVLAWEHLPVALAQRLRDCDVPTLDLSKSVPGLPTQTIEDGFHPSAAADRRVAEFLWAWYQHS